MAELDAGKNSRTLVLCFDGTTNKYDAENTNVVKFFSLLEKDKLDEQLVYYQPGVGTYFNPGVVSPFFEWAARLLDEATAWYLSAHVMDGYRYLMQNYRAGDKICLFGFSRGAYTARALAGFLHKVGLLSRDNQEQIPFAYTLYRRTDAEGLTLCKGYKKTYCRDVKIEFIGVWDTVSSVGIIAGKTLPFVVSNKAIKTFRHALSLDERRCKFQPNTYHRIAPNKAGAKDDPEHASPVLGTPDNFVPWLRPRWGLFSIFHRQDASDVEEEEDSKSDACDVLEVWFAGCHSDVGGGAVPNSTPHSLENITLRWMVNEVMSSGCGILFSNEALARNQIPIPTTLASSANQPSPTLAEDSSLDKIDALQPIDDELVKKKSWWMLEILPLMQAWQDGDGVWHKKMRVNMGKGRTIYDHAPKFHITVKQRMSDKNLKYKPRATWEKGKEEYVA